MNKITQKLKVLSKIAKTFNENNILWAIGGSTLLYLKNIVNNFDDIDIIVDENQIELVTRLLLEVGSLEPQNPHSNFKTKHFLEFVIDFVDVDVMAGFIIVKDNKDYYFPLQQNDISKTIIINDQQIPLHSIKQWKKYYQLMNRMDKVNLINNYFNQK